MPQHRHITALGSSFAAGPGIEPVEDAAAMRSSRNYAHLLAERIGADLVDLSVSGATTDTILDVPQVTMTGVEYPPQIQGLPRNADLVTLTAGGNDLKYAMSMLYAAWSRVEPGGAIAMMSAQEFADGIPRPTDTDVEAMARGLIRIVNEVRNRASGARVILVDYLTVLDESTEHDPESPFSAAETASLLRIRDGIARGYEIAATRSGAELLRASELSTDHGLGSADPWVFGFQPSLEKTAASFHPNGVGMAAIAGELVRLLTD